MPGRPARERGRRVEEVDFESAKVMMSELENACQEFKYSEANPL